MVKAILRCWRIVWFVVLLFNVVCCQKNDMLIVADEQVKVYKDCPDGGLPGDVLAVLDGGEAAIVIHSRYSKDFMYYKVVLKDGREGYVCVGDKFRVERKQ